jgi:hypothetical protein
MKCVKNIIWRSRRRKIATIVSTVSLVVVSAAAAYFLLEGFGNTTAETNLGQAAQQALTMHTSVGAGLTPNGAVPVRVTVDPVTGSSVHIASLTPGAISTPNDASCAAYLALSPNADALPVTIPGAGPAIEIGSYSLTMDDPGTNQTHCAGTAVSIPFTIP